MSLPQRHSKEEAHDYRYFPDPNLLPFEFDDAFIADLAKDFTPATKAFVGAAKAFSWPG